MISESSVISYKDDIIGYINIESIHLTSNLVQGLDNTFYLSHNYLGNESESGEIFLDYQGDLLNNNNAIIYSKINNIRDAYFLNKGDKIEILYLKNRLCYEITYNKTNDLLLKIYNKNNTLNIFAKKIAC